MANSSSMDMRLIKLIITKSSSLLLRQHLMGCNNNAIISVFGTPVIYFKFL